ncbi:MAG: hypothetical protein AABX73_01375 [Nanoarchaeota archaeon]
MRREEIILISVLAIAALSLLLIPSSGMMGYGYGMMGGFGYGGIPIFGFIIMILLITALILFIVWIVRQLEGDRR